MPLSTILLFTPSDIAVDGLRVTVLLRLHSKAGCTACQAGDGDALLYGRGGKDYPSFQDYNKVGNTDTQGYRE